ncbi:protein DpdJ [Kitasatospora aureofaciens]|uniref:protein DpdJ n=1 Tax=Kitasatospora aureofaciens TaxID=1894 RepID=UPI0036F45C13
MTQRINSDFANELLNRLEDLELPLLAWGMTEGALAETEVLAAIEETLTCHPTPPADATADDVLDQCRDMALLFCVPGSSPPRYRTRLAESLRLTAGLRQLFAPRSWAGPPEAGWWQHGKRLVADYRLHIAPRRYPRRDIEAATVLQELASLTGWGEVQQHTAAAQLQGRSLARFQVDASKAVFASLGQPQSKGLIIGAGTGSGKTLAFYLPAFAAMAQEARPGSARVHTLALYPRKELLRDQLREAVRTADSIGNALHRAGRRPLRIGALYGDTPWNARDRRLEAGANASGAWTRKRGGAVCPYLTCPQCETGDLLWSDEDRRAEKESLTCVKCRHTIQHGRISLTRDSLRRTPPDLLFTTTEMLNRNSANPDLEGLLGWRGGSPPALVLLDEVHTYSGMHGAQVALLLRRWRKATRRTMTFVGLSATLKDADRFFAELVGLRASDVESIEPSATDMVAEGREYAIALRGDPVAGASLLSTSIQTAMLYGRVLDPDSERFLFGSTGFLFTDDLDVTNRFYDDLRDAEGGQSRFGARTGAKPVLAGLRAAERPEHAARYRDGQSWDVVEQVGHDLDPGLRRGELRIGRTSSQDVGVDLGADLTVATASLEVGFNDPRVGLVMQHKAPRDAAAFIQRRGRAGRQRGTRPITVITLSDYGRDRLAYQAYETLFAPQVPIRRLPIGNRFVLKIQAAQALLDWLGQKLRTRRVWADPRALLAAPRNGLRSEDDQARELLSSLLQTLLDDPRLQDDLANHLRSALQVSADEAQALLWEQPRSLLLGVVPTTLRRVGNRWKSLRDDPGATRGSLLPEYVTRSLFEPLNLPEVELELPFEDGESDERLPIAKALREAVPGRVSRRYGHRRDEHRTWLPMPEPGTSELDLLQLVASGTPEGPWRPHGVGGDIEVVRPHRLILQSPPADITDRSQGTPWWHTEIVLPDDAPPSPGDLPDPSPWRQRVAGIGFATHAAGNPVEVRRMTTGAECDISYERGRSESRTVRYTLRGRPAALGFRLGVDAVRISVTPIDLSDPAVLNYLTSPQWRSLAFARAVAEDPTLAELANAFQRDRLAQVYLTAFALAGLDGARTSEEISTELAAGSWRLDLPEIFRVLYREADPTGHGVDNDRLVTALTELARDQRVIDALNRAGHLLVAPDIVERTANLAQRVYNDTLAAAILAAALRACPDAQDGDLIVDVLPGAGSADPAVVWLSETSIGGLGVVEQFVRSYTEDPRRFWGLVAAALAPSDYEYVDAAVTRLLRHLAVEPGGTAARAMATLRGPVPAMEAERSLGALRRAWALLDGPPRHSAVAALSTRLLRPGSGPDTDSAVLALVDSWTALERRLGIEVDAHVMAYAVGSGRLQLGGTRRLSADQAFSMLWPRGRQARTQHLEHYQPYADRPILDRLLMEAAYDDRLPRIDVTAADWTMRYQKVMAESAAVDLVCPAADGRAMGDALVHVPVLRVDRDVMRVYGEVRGFARHGDELRARVELREAVQ